MIRGVTLGNFSNPRCTKPARSLTGSVSPRCGRTKAALWSSEKCRRLRFVGAFMKRATRGHANSRARGFQFHAGAREQPSCREFAKRTLAPTRVSSSTPDSNRRDTRSLERPVNERWPTMRTVPASRISLKHKSLLLRARARTRLPVFQVGSVRQCPRPVGDGHETALQRGGCRSARPNPLVSALFAQVECERRQRRGTRTWSIDVTSTMTTLQPVPPPITR